jgi:hypothetical protein
MTVLVTLTVVVPCLLGVFWGGPLVARELETGTSQFAWMQSITRRHWLAVKVGWALLAAAVWGGAVSALVTWWSSPANALKQQNFLPSQFDIQGIVPVGYALFAAALGIAAGTLLRRTLPALAITIGVFTFLRLVIGQDLRSHYLTAITKTSGFPPGHSPVLPKGSYWPVSQGLVGPGGKIPTTPDGGISLTVSSSPSPPPSSPSPQSWSCAATRSIRYGLRREPRPTSITGTARFMPATFYIASLP